jgi:IS605 OrfB family transposase
VCQQVFEEAAVDCGRALAAFATSGHGKRRGRRVGFPRFKRKTGTTGSFRIRQKTWASRAAIRVGDPVSGPRSVTLPTIGVLRVIANVRRYFLPEVANQLVQTHDRLALEDLNVAGMLRNHHLAAAISDAAWAELARIVTYKQQWRGGHTIVVDRWFPSSKTCAACGAILATLTLADRAFCCPACGHTADRDLNAATNLGIWAEQHHARIRDPEVRGPVTNAYRGDGSGRRASARRRNQPR